VTGDLRRLPFADATFDYVVSSLVIHNINGKASRRQALAEAVRVLKPGGRLVIADIAHAKRYAADLADLGLRDVNRQSLGWRFWFFGPLVRTSLVGGRKAEHVRAADATRPR
jgi:arsenite methyltransferase